MENEKKIDGLRVLIVEDDKEIRGLLADFLGARGYVCDVAADGREGSEMLLKGRYDVALVDMMMPYKSGDALIAELRARTDDAEAAKMPVIVLSAKSGMDTRLETLKMGADDYIIKPFNLDEVAVRIEVVLRRSGHGTFAEQKGEKSHVLSHGDIAYDTELNTVTACGEELRLTAKEQKLLLLFLENPGKTFSKANLYESVWEEDYCYEDNTINVHMSNLRNKLKKACGHDVIETVWGIGYKLL